MALEVVSSILVARPTITLGCRQVVKAPDFDSGIRRFKSCHPSHFFGQVFTTSYSLLNLWPISSVGRAPDF